MAELTSGERRSIRECGIIVVDTGPLMSILVLKYAFSREPNAARSIIYKSRIADYIREDQTMKQAMVRLFDEIRRLTTTSHVIGELQGLQKLTDDHQVEFWNTAMNWLALKNLDESLIALLDLHGKARGAWVKEIGPTDAGLLQLTLKKGAVLLTDDHRTLTATARAAKVDCRLVREELLYYRPNSA